MHCFFVIARENSGITDDEIATVFPKHYIVVSGYVWVVAHTDPIGTTMDVCKMLNIGQGGKTGIVLSVSQYNGYFDSALWESMAQWGSAP